MQGTSQGINHGVLYAYLIIVKPNRQIFYISFSVSIVVGRNVPSKEPSVHLEFGWTWCVYMLKELSIMVASGKTTSELHLRMEPSRSGTDSSTECKSNSTDVFLVKMWVDYYCVSWNICPSIHAIASATIVDVSFSHHILKFNILQYSIITNYLCFKCILVRVLALSELEGSWRTLIRKTKCSYPSPCLGFLCIWF